MIDLVPILHVSALPLALYSIILLVHMTTTSLTYKILYSANVWRRKSLANFPSEAFGQIPACLVSL